MPFSKLNIPYQITVSILFLFSSARYYVYTSLLFAASQNSLCVTSKVTEVTLERIDGSLGITLRGGMILDQPHLSRALVITHVRPNGPAHR